jgi:hypothetical protein
VFPVRYELKFYTIFRRNSVFKMLIMLFNKIYVKIHGRKLFKFLCSIDSFLCNDRETYNKKTAVARQQINNKQQ